MRKVGIFGQYNEKPSLDFIVAKDCLILLAEDMAVKEPILMAIQKRIQQFIVILNW